MNNINQVSPRFIINSYYNALPKTEKKIANYVLNYFDEMNAKSITEISEALDVSESSILRFTKRLGYKGFKEFKIYCGIFEENSQSTNNFEEFSNETLEIQTVLEANIRSNVNNLKLISKFIDQDVLENIAHNFLKYKKIFIVGSGYSSTLATYLYHLLFTTEKDVNLSTSAFNLQQFSYKVDKDSFIFFISQKGRNADALRFVDFAQKKGAATGCLTRIANNPLSEVVDEPLIVNSLTNKEASNYLLTQVSFTTVINTIFMYISTQLQKENPEYSSEFLDGFEHLHQIFGMNQSFDDA